MYDQNILAEGKHLHPVLACTVLELGNLSAGKECCPSPAVMADDCHEISTIHGEFPSVPEDIHLMAKAYAHRISLGVAIPQCGVGLEPPDSTGRR